LIVDFGKKRVFFSGFCCDSPAVRSFILKTKGHTGFSRLRCTIEGVYLENRVCFPSGISFDSCFTFENFLQFKKKGSEIWKTSRAGYKTLQWIFAFFEFKDSTYKRA